MKRSLSLTVVVLVSVIAATLFTGVAYAYYRTGIAADSNGKAVDATVVMDARKLTFTLTSPSTAALYPGSPAAFAAINLVNPFSRPISVTNVSGVATGSTCTAGDLTSTPTGVPATLSPGTTTVWLTNLAQVSLAASSGCQGATITVTVTVTARLA